MKKNILISLFVLLILTTCAFAEVYESEFDTFPVYSRSKASNLQVKSLRYEPYPINPGEYFKLWIKVENLGTGYTRDATFELIEKFPFSLDSKEDARISLGKIGYGKVEEDNVIVLEYKIKVDKDATEGTNEIQLRYNEDGSDSWLYKTFDIEVEDAQTDFDLVVQESTDNEVSIAIANTGKNVASSVIVKIPEQENFQVVGTSGQMVGNLENGDYTLVSFELKPKARLSDQNLLQVQIDYTDNIGERRSLLKGVMFEVGRSSGAALPANGEMPEGMSERMGRFSPMIQQKVIYQEWWFWAIIVAVLFIGWKFFKKTKERKRKKK